MHRALWQLLWFDLLGSVRGLLDLHRNWRRLGLALLMLLFVGLLLSSRALTTANTAGDRFGDAMPFWALIYLLVTWLTSSADRGLVMRPAEIHFVVGGPFPNRDVITLNLVRLAFRALISALVLGLVASAYVHSYLSALIGVWMLITVSLLVGMIVSLSARKAHGRAIAVARRVLVLIALLSLLGLILQSMQLLQASGTEPRISTVAAAAIHTPIGQILLPPLGWMFAPMASSSFFAETLQLLPLRLAVIGVLVIMVYMLGGQYGEASTGRTDASIARRDVAERSGVAGGAIPANWTRRLSLPAPSRLGGVGSVAWMQMVHSLRILPRYIVFTASIVGFVLVIPMMVDAQRLQGTNVVSWMAGLTAYADFLLLLQLPVGFLGPVAQREMLKSLPIPAWRIAVGQLAGPVIPLGVLHLAVMILFLVLSPNNSGYVLQTSLALVPAAVVLIANINLLGAWNIIRPRALQQRDALAAGRAMASVWIFMAMLTPALIVATICVAGAGFLLGQSLSTTLIGASVGLMLASLLYIVLLARSFAAWQPTSGDVGMEEVEYDH